MWARVSTYLIPPDDLEKAIQQIDQAVDAFRGRAGLVRVDVFANRRSGAAITISYWESEDAMKASEDAADDLRRGIALEVFGWIQGVKEYELIRTEPAA
jgi:hypothetical protein